MLAKILRHHHLLTFADRPRLCLGRGFVLAEYKVSDKYSSKFVLQHHYPNSRQHFWSLSENYLFELPEGITTKIERVVYHL